MVGFARRKVFSMFQDQSDSLLNFLTVPVGQGCWQVECKRWKELNNIPRNFSQGWHSYLVAFFDTPCFQLQMLGLFFWLTSLPKLSEGAFPYCHNMGTEPIFIKWSDMGAKNKWSEIDGFHWGHFAPISGVRSPFLYNWWLWAQFAPVKAQCGISKGKSPVGWGSSLRSRLMIWEDPNVQGYVLNPLVGSGTHPPMEKKHESCFFFWGGGVVGKNCTVRSSGSINGFPGELNAFIIHPQWITSQASTILWPFKVTSGWQERRLFPVQHQVWEMLIWHLRTTYDLIVQTPNMERSLENHLMWKIGDIHTSSFMVDFPLSC